MSIRLRLLVLALFASLLLSANASASPLRFTATDMEWGTLGFMEYDSLVFNGTAGQRVSNSFLLLIDFTDPQSGIHVVAPGPPGDETIFDSTGLLPAVVGGVGFTGGTDFTNGVWIAGTDYVWVGAHEYDEVSWTTSESPGPVPEPASLLLFSTGLVGLRAWRKRWL